MTYPGNFSALVERHNRAIKFGREGTIKRGNRCAMVMGIALHLYPQKNKGQTSMREIRGLDHEARNLAKGVMAKVVGAGDYDEAVTGPDQPFMDRFFVKARDLAEQIKEKYGEPDVTGEGKILVTSNKLAAKGIMYLAGFWHGGTGDHIDLWDGQKLNVTGAAEASRREIAASKTIWFWKTIS